MQEPLRILMFGTDHNVFKPGSDVRIRMLEYARLFDHLSVVVLTPRGYHVEMPTENLSLHPTNSLFFFLRPFDAFFIGSRIIRQNGITVLSVQDPAESGFAGWLLKKRFGISLNIQLHSDFLSPFFKRNSYKEFIRFLLARLLLPSGDSFRVVSQRIKDSLIATFGIQPSKITVLPIYVDRKATLREPPVFALHDKYPQFDFIILMVSRLFREKNIKLALLAFRETLRQFPKTGLIIVGDGPERKNLEFRIQNLELSNHIRFEGWQDDLAFYYKGADLYLLTSNFEGYGRSVVEAVSAGLPVVMTDVGVAGELICDHETGRVVPPRNVEALSNAIGEARRLGPDMRRMADKAKEVLLHTPPITKDDYLKMYKDSLLRV